MQTIVYFTCEFTRLRVRRRWIIGAELGWVDGQFLANPKYFWPTQQVGPFPQVCDGYIYNLTNSTDHDIADVYHRFALVCGVSCSDSRTFHTLRCHCSVYLYVMYSVARLGSRGQAETQQWYGGKASPHRWSDAICAQRRNNTRLASLRQCRRYTVQRLFTGRSIPPEEVVLVWHFILVFCFCCLLIDCMLVPSIECIYTHLSLRSVNDRVRRHNSTWFAAIQRICRTPQTATFTSLYIYNDRLTDNHFIIWEYPTLMVRGFQNSCTSIAIAWRIVL